MAIKNDIGKALTRLPAPASRRRRSSGGLLPGLLEASRHPRRRHFSTEPEPADKLLSLELELGGLAVEFKARRFQGVVTGLALATAATAVVQELMRPRQFRTWHGRVAGVIPYDFRKPTARRILRSLWAPDDPRLFTETAFGIGWSINLAQLPRVLLSDGRHAPEPQPYEAPRVVARR